MWRYRFTRLLLFLIFSSYLIVMVLVNLQRFEEWIAPLERLGWAHKVCDSSHHLCLGSYAHKRELLDNRITLLISLLDPSLPLSRELVTAQKKLSKELGIRFVSLPMDSPLEDSESFKKLQNLIRQHPKDRIYINAYFYDERMKKLAKLLLKNP